MAVGEKIIFLFLLGISLGLIKSSESHLIKHSDGGESIYIHTGKTAALEVFTNSGDIIPTGFRVERYPKGLDIENTTEVERLSFVYGTCFVSAKNRPLGISIIRVIENFYPLLQKDFSLDVTPQMQVFIMDTKEAMAKNLDIAPENSKEVPMGAYFNGNIFFLAPDAWIQDRNEAETMDIFLESGPILHELTHFIMDHSTQIPHTTWINEGTALYFEYKYLGSLWRADLATQSKEMPNQLLRNFHHLDPSVGYKKAFDVIYSYVDTHGEKEFMKLLLA